MIAKSAFEGKHIMQRTTGLHCLFLSIALAGIACANNQKATLTTVVAASTVEQTQSADATVQKFTPVEGSDLTAKLEAARVKARGGQMPYWSAYTFDVRPGVAIDPGVHEFHGSMNTIGDTSVFVGTTAGGVTVE